MAGTTISKAPKSDSAHFLFSVSDADLLAAIDAMEFDTGETEIWVTERENAKTVR